MAEREQDFKRLYRAKGLRAYVQIEVVEPGKEKEYELKLFQQKQEAIEEVNRILYTRFNIGKKDREGRLTPNRMIEKIAKNFDKLDKSRESLQLQIGWFKFLGADLEDLYQKMTKEIIPWKLMQFKAKSILFCNLIDSYFIGLAQSPPPAQPPLF